MEKCVEVMGTLRPRCIAQETSLAYVLRFTFKAPE